MKDSKSRKRPAKSLRRRAEESLASTPEDRHALPPKESASLIHELEVHQVELQMQNEELRQAHEELEKSRDRYAALYDFAPICLLTLDRDGRIVEANLAASELLGVERQKLRKRTFNRFIAPESQDTFYLLQRRIFADEPGQSGEIALLPPAGPRRTVYLTGAPERDPTTEEPRIRLSLSDVTERVLLEQELLDVAERERRQVGHELHDDLGQILHGTHFLATELEDRLEKNGAPEAVDLRRVSESLKQALETTRGLARGLEPVPPVPDGLMIALREHAKRVHEVYGVDCRFSCPKPVYLRNRIVATHLFRIAQEAVSNAVKHAECSNITIRLARAAGRILLMIKDDGNGDAPKPAERKGMGLQVIQFRAAAIYGSLVIQRPPTGGTELVLTVGSPHGLPGA